MKAQLQALDGAAPAAAPSAAAAKAPKPRDFSPPDFPCHDAFDEEKGASTPDVASESDRGSDDENPLDAEVRKAAAAERQRQQRTLHQRRKAICVELDRTKQAVRWSTDLKGPAPGPNPNPSGPVPEATSTVWTWGTTKLGCCGCSAL